MNSLRQSRRRAERTWFRSVSGNPRVLSERILRRPKGWSDRRGEAIPYDYWPPPLGNAAPLLVTLRRANIWWLCRQGRGQPIAREFQCTPLDIIYAASPSALEFTLLGEGNEADLDLIGAETSDHLWRHITKKAEGFPSPVIGTATLAVETGIRARAGTIIVRK